MSSTRDRLLAASLLALLLFSRSSPANADDGATPAPTPTKTTTTWYGHQTLAADGASLALTVVGGSLAPTPESRSAFGFAGVGSYLLAPFVIHAAHGHVARGAGSLALRGLAPIAGALLGLAVAGAYLSATPEPDNGLATAARAYSVAAVAMHVGAGVGAVSAMTIDSAVLARETKPADAVTARHVQPTLSATRNGASLGLAGTF